MKGIPQGGLAWTVGKLFFNGLKMPCVQLSKDADPNEAEKPIDAVTTVKKTAKMWKAKRYKKFVIPDSPN